ncbi:MAG: efflux RND transporter periplasmic adaptor subunit [Rhodanobacteraceae bacterium]
MCIGRPLASLVAIGLLAACSAKSPPATSVAAAPDLAAQVVHTEKARREQVWDGVVEAVHEVTLSAQTTARVLELPYDVNDSVPEGAVIVRFTDVEQKSARTAAQAQIASARATYTDAQASYKRNAAIYARGLVAKAVLDQALAARDAALAALRSAEAQSRQIGQQLDYTVVRAPYAGVITHRYVHVGESVQAGPPAPQRLIAMASLKDLRVTVQVPQSAIAAIRKFASAEVLLDNDSGRRVSASKVTVFPYADPQTHTFNVRMELPGDNTHLYPGMTVKVAFAIGEASYLLIPESSLIRRGEMLGVYVLGDHGVSLRQVRAGDRNGNRIEILAGLDDGEKVVTDPAAAARWLLEQRTGAKT